MARRVEPYAAVANLVIPAAISLEGQLPLGVAEGTSAFGVEGLCGIRCPTAVASATAGRMTCPQGQRLCPTG
jgi:hypothetical protein